mgnify:CR=1 FL=1
MRPQAETITAGVTADAVGFDVSACRFVELCRAITAERAKGTLSFHGWMAYATVNIVDDDEALQAFHDLCHYEGIIPALESAHAVAYAAKIAPTLPKAKALLVNLSGRGDKDMQTVADKMGIRL